MMKRILLTLAVLASAVGIYAQTALQQIAANRMLSAGNYQAYPVPTATLTPAPDGYTPFYISTYGRHGSRYLIMTSQYESPRRTLAQADSLGMLTERGRQVKDILQKLCDMSDGRLGELTAAGARQHQGIAQRMYRNFPEVFEGNATVDARSTIVIRCILSMANECMTLKSLNPDLQITQDASEHDMSYMNRKGPRFDSLYYKGEAIRVYSEFAKEHTHPERLMKVLFNDDNYIRDNVDGSRLMQQLFALAGNMQSHDTDMELFSLFTDQECYDMWLCNNAFWFFGEANSALTGGWMPYREAELLRDMLDKADLAVAGQGNAADLRFGHESCLLPLVCLLELDDYGKEHNDLESLDTTWRSYEIFPMACNVQFVFYRNPNNSDILVKAMLNEREVRLPVGTNNAPYYRWDDVEKYYRAKIAYYDASVMR